MIWWWKATDLQGPCNLLFIQRDTSRNIAEARCADTGGQGVSLRAQVGSDHGGGGDPRVEAGAFRWRAEPAQRVARRNGRWWHQDVEWRHRCGGHWKVPEPTGNRRARAFRADISAGPSRAEAPSGGSDAGEQKSAFWGNTSAQGIEGHWALSQDASLVRYWATSGLCVLCECVCVLLHLLLVSIGTCCWSPSDPLYPLLHLQLVEAVLAFSEKEFTGHAEHLETNACHSEIAARKQRNSFAKRSRG